MHRCSGVRGYSVLGLTLGCKRLGTTGLVQWPEEDWPDGLGAAVGPSEVFISLEGGTRLKSLGTRPCVFGPLESLAEGATGPRISGLLVVWPILVLGRASVAHCLELDCWRCLLGC